MEIQEIGVVSCGLMGWAMDAAAATTGRGVDDHGT